MSDYQIRYNKSRFPIQPKLPDGSWGCRGCGGPLPKGRTAWCSKQCCDRWHPSFVISAVKQRDKEVCAECGYDVGKAQREWWVARREIDKLFQHWDFKARPPDNSEYRTRFDNWLNNKPRKIEYDHIVPFSEGGFTVVENIRSLCEVCHKQRTRHWHKLRAEARKAASRSPMQQNLFAGAYAPPSSPGSGHTGQGPATVWD